VSLSEIFREVRDAEPSLDAGQLRQVTLDVVRYALERGEARAGSFDRTTWSFVVWLEPTDEIIDRINEQWSQLGSRDPNPGELGWLASPNMPGLSSQTTGKES
jgi:hypothetical protein